MVVDPSTPDGAHADERLRAEPIIWLASVRPDGQAQTTPVWFLWDGTSILIHSKPDASKVRNVKANPRVALNLYGDGTGGNIVTLEGRAEHLPFAPPATEVEPYVEKYGDLIARLGTEPEPFPQIYSAALRVTPTRLRVY